MCSKGPSCDWNMAEADHYYEVTEQRIRVKALSCRRGGVRVTLWNRCLLFLFLQIGCLALEHRTSDLRVSSVGETESWSASLEGNEKLALEAIRFLHRQLDDDQDGNINLDESNDYLREELKYERDFEKRQKAFHQNNDNQVTVRELWETWVKSEVHNWTVEQTVEWLSTCVGLPQYQDSFLDKSINGSYLPILAVNHQQFLPLVIGVKDAIHKQKISLKAQDVVLFGPPKENNNHVKDAVLMSLLVIAVTVCWFIYRRYKSSQRELVKMIKDMESLAKAEKELMDLQYTIETNKIEQDKLTAQAEDSLRKRSTVNTDLPDEEISEEVGRLRGEVEVLRNELQRAEVELQDKCWVPPPALQHWLQLTYELELKSYNKKKQSAERQLRQAKDACDKLKKKRSSLMGAFVSTHGKSIDDVDKAILEAKTSLTEITHELQERMHRWKQIEMLVSCPIVNNPGLHYLETVLRGYGKAPSYGGPGSVISNSQDDIDDDAASSIYCPSAVHKLVSTSTYLMFPAGPPNSAPPSSTSAAPTTARRALQQQSNSNVTTTSTNVISPAHTESPTNTNSSCLPSIPHSQTDQGLSSNTAPSEISPSSEADDAVSAPATSGNVHLPIMRSKSVSSMIGLRERATRDLLNREAAAAAEDDIPNEACEMPGAARDRRVTFGIRQDQRNNGKVSNASSPGEGVAIISGNKEQNGPEQKLILKFSQTTKNGHLTIQNPEGREETGAGDAQDCRTSEEPDLIKMSPCPPKISDSPALGIVETPRREVNGSARKRLFTSPAPAEKVSENTLAENVIQNGKKKHGVWKSIQNLVTSNGDVMKPPRGHKVGIKNGISALPMLAEDTVSEKNGNAALPHEQVKKQSNRLFSSFRKSKKHKDPQKP